MPFCFSPGDTISADEINQNFEFVANPAFRAIERVHGSGGRVQGSGPVAQRSLMFNKTSNDTALRVIWQDNLQAYRLTADAACSWEIKFGGSSCAGPGPLLYPVYVGGGRTGVDPMGVNVPKSITGTCEGLPAGHYNVQVFATPESSRPDSQCITGGHEAYFSLEVEEVR